jgi:2-dehydropantoate 2-reductase
VPARADYPRVGVLGAGAVGRYVGGELAAHGVEVVFVGRRTDASVLKNREVVLCCVKSTQTVEASSRLASVLAPSAVTVSLQNGMHNGEVLRSHLDGRSVLAGIIGFNVVVREDGVVRRTTSGPLVIEATRDPRIHALAGALSASGFDARLAANVQALQWGKLLMNLNNAVSALSGATTPELLFSKGYRAILAAIVGEALRVMRHAGVRPASLTGLPLGLMPFVLRLPTPLLRAVARTQLKIDPGARSSMWEDLSKGRPTEVDDLNGEIVRLAGSVGVQAPLNRRVVEVVHGYERRGGGSPRLGPEALASELSLEPTPRTDRLAGERA